jgi:HPt (histidine-containing phosphotransfer) domain-containing protein
MLMPDAEPAILNLEILADLRLLQQPEEPDIVQEVVAIFLVDSTARARRAREELAAGDLPAVARTAHQVKGSASMVGADRMMSIAAELEAAAVGGEIDRAARLIAMLAETFEVTRRALDDGSSQEIRRLEGQELIDPTK